MFHKFTRILGSFAKIIITRLYYVQVSILKMICLTYYINLELIRCIISACAHAFYKAGAKVILCARREVELQRVKADLINDTLVGA